MDPELAQAIAMINAQIAQGRLQLDRDIYGNIQLPTYQNITYPTSVGQNTGYLPSGYPGGFGGLPTFGALTGAASQFGNAVGNDPRWAQLGIPTGSLTLGGQAQRLAEDAQRARQVEFSQQLGLQQQQTGLDQANKDRQYALEINADPNSVIGGQIIPDWMKPHAEWARQFAAGNAGRLPTIQDLRNTLSAFGRTPEDYLAGGRFAGQNSNVTVEPLGAQPGTPGAVPSAGLAGSGTDVPPVIGTGGVAKLNADYQALKAQRGGNLSYNDPDLQRIYQQDLGGDAATNLARAQAASDWSRAHPGQTIDPATQMQIYGEAGQTQRTAAAQAPADDGGGMQRTTSYLRASPTNPMTQEMLRQANIGQAQDGSAQWAAGARQAGIPEAQIQQMLAQDASARQTFNAGGNRAATLAPGQSPYGGQQSIGNTMMGYQRGGYPLGGQQGYGGGGLSPAVNYGGSGATGQIGYGQAMSLDQRRLLEQGRQADIAAGFTQNSQRLQALAQESQLRADPFALARYRYGLQNGGVLGAIGGQGVIPGAQGPQGRAPAPPSLYNQEREAQGMPTFGQDPMQQLQGLPALNQISGRNYYRAGAQGQNFANSAYRAAGLAGTDQDVQEAARRALPQFARRGVPTFGRAA